MDPLSIVILVIVVGFLVWAVMRLQKRAINPPKLQVAMELIANINDDFKVISQKKTDPQNLKKFKIGRWNSYQEHLDFLELADVEALKTAFKQMEEYNGQVEASQQTGSPPPSFSAEALLAPLSQGRLGLAAWIRDNIGKESTRGMFSWR